MESTKNFTEEYEFNDSQRSTEDSLYNEDTYRNTEEFLDIERNNEDKYIEQRIKEEEENVKENKLNKGLDEQFESKINVKNSSKKNDKFSCPIDEKYTYDPYLESNFINRFFFYWAYKILKLSKKYKLKIKDLGKPASNNNANIFFK